MDALQEDTDLVLALCAWAKVKPSRMATDLGMAATTLARPASGKATTRMSRATRDALRAAYPDFPGWTAGERPESNAIPFKMEGASERRMRDDLPIYGSALGASRQVDGEAIELTTLNKAEVMSYAKRPVLLDGNAKAYGLWVSGSSMEPRHMDGAIVLVDPDGRLRNGDDVVVYLRPDNAEDDDGETARAVLVKRLVRRSASYVDLEQFTPAKVFRIDMAEVIRIDRVIPWSEMLG